MFSLIATMPYVLRLVRSIQEKESLVPQSLDPADKRRDVGIVIGQVKLKVN